MFAHRIILIRHGETTVNVVDEIPEHMYAHVHKPSLTDQGRLQSARVADALINAQFTIDQIEVSPLLRAAETAYFTIERLGNVPVTIEPNVCEFFRACPPESIYDFEGRISRLLARWTACVGSEPRTTLVFTHSHVINSLLRRAVGQPPIGDGAKFQINNGSVSVLDIMRDGSFIVQMTNSLHFT
jgi:broad specificity phosphatase PhoE